MHTGNDLGDTSLDAGQLTDAGDGGAGFADDDSGLLGADESAERELMADSGRGVGGDRRRGVLRRDEVYGDDEVDQSTDGRIQKRVIERQLIFRTVG